MVQVQKNTSAGEGVSMCVLKTLVKYNKIVDKHESEREIAHLVLIHEPDSIFLVKFNT